MSSLVTLKKVSKDRYSYWTRYPSPRSWSVTRTATGWLVDDAIAAKTLAAARETVTRLARQHESADTPPTSERPPAKPFGFYWELVHASTNGVVNSGFTKDSTEPQWRESLSGFEYRFMPLYTAPQVEQ